MAIRGTSLDIPCSKDIYDEPASWMTAGLLRLPNNFQTVLAT
jgi:hypothetical protein